MQKALSAVHIAEFYHDRFVADQVADFVALVGVSLPVGSVVVDIGGGCGFFASALSRIAPWRLRVLDTDPVSVRSCTDKGIDARVSDALAPVVAGDESVVCFNLILHHLVGSSAAQTRDLQCRALRAWHGCAKLVFVNEYVYESYLLPRLSAYLIWGVTSSRALSLLGRVVSRFVPSLRANTFGVGVRFRSAQAWVELFDSVGFELVSRKAGRDEPVSLARRLLFIKHCRRDSFVLRARAADRP